MSFISCRQAGGQQQIVSGISPLLTAFVPPFKSFGRDEIPPQLIQLIRGQAGSALAEESVVPAVVFLFVQYLAVPIPCPQVTSSTYLPRVRSFTSGGSPVLQVQPWLWGP
jgi:hypothetical protein